MDKIVDKIVDKIPAWLKGRQLSAGALEELHEVKQPVAVLYQLLDDEVPDYLYPLAMAARMIDNFALYGEPVADKARALGIIEQARKELRHAEQRCRDERRQNKTG